MTLPLDIDGFPNPQYLPTHALLAIVRQVQEVLWSEDGRPNPQKEWGGDEIEKIAEVLIEYGLRPPEEESDG